MNDRCFLSGCGVLQMNYPGNPSCAWLHVKGVDMVIIDVKLEIVFLPDWLLSNRVSGIFCYDLDFRAGCCCSYLIGCFWLTIMCGLKLRLVCKLWLYLISRLVSAFLWISTQPIVGSSSGASGLTNSPLGCKMNRSSLALQCNPYVYSSG